MGRRSYQKDGEDRVLKVMTYEGLWAKDIVEKSKLPRTSVHNILKKLEERKQVRRMPIKGISHESKFHKSKWTKVSMDIDIGKKREELMNHILMLKKGLKRNPTLDEIAQKIGLPPEDPGLRKEVYLVSGKMGWKEVSQSKLLAHSNELLLNVKNEDFQYAIAHLLENKPFVTFIKEPVGVMDWCIYPSGPPQMPLPNKKSLVAFCEHLTSGYPEIILLVDEILKLHKEVPSWVEIRNKFIEENFPEAMFKEVVGLIDYLKRFSGCKFKEFSKDDMKNLTEKHKFSLEQVKLIEKFIIGCRDILEKEVALEAELADKRRTLFDKIEDIRFKVVHGSILNGTCNLCL